MLTYSRSKSKTLIHNGEYHAVYETDYTVFTYLKTRGESDRDTVAKELDIARSTVFDALKRLKLIKVVESERTDGGPGKGRTKTIWKLRKDPVESSF